MSVGLIRFLTLATLIRSLRDRYASSHEEHLRVQIDNLRYRVRLIRNMQVFGVSSFFCCVLCMFLLFAGLTQLGVYSFGLALILLLVSLALSLREVQVSVDALTVELEHLAEED